MNNPFKYKCICDWSRNDKYGFIPNTKCKAHGKETRRFLRRILKRRRLC